MLPSRRWARKGAPAGGRKPPIVGMRLTDERPDIDDRAVPGNWEGDLIIGKDGASAMGDPGRAHHALPRPGGPSPGQKGRPGAGALTRRIRALPDGAMSTLTWDQGSEMAHHQRQGRRHRDRRVLRPPPQPLGKGHEREHQPPPRAATCPKAPPSPATNPYPGRHRRRTGQLPPRYPRLPHPTRSIHSTHCHHPSSLVRKKSELTAEQYAHQRKMLIVSGAIMVVCIAAIVGILNLIG